MARATLSDAFLDIRRKPLVRYTLEFECAGRLQTQKCMASHEIIRYAKGLYRISRKAMITSYCMACKDAFPQL